MVVPSPPSLLWDPSHLRSKHFLIQESGTLHPAYTCSQARPLLSASVTNAVG